MNKQLTVEELSNRQRIVRIGNHLHDIKRLCDANPPISNAQPFHHEVRPRQLIRGIRRAGFNRNAQPHEIRSRPLIKRKQPDVKGKEAVEEDEEEYRREGKSGQEGDGVLAETRENCRSPTRKVLIISEETYERKSMEKGGNHLNNYGKIPVPKRSNGAQRNRSLNPPTKGSDAGLTENTEENGLELSDEVVEKERLKQIFEVVKPLISSTTDMEMRRKQRCCLSAVMSDYSITQRDLKNLLSYLHNKDVLRNTEYHSSDRVQEMIETLCTGIGRSSHNHLIKVLSFLLENDCEEIFEKVAQKMVNESSCSPYLPQPTAPDSIKDDFKSNTITQTTASSQTIAASSEQEHADSSAQTVAKSTTQATASNSSAAYLADSSPHVIANSNCGAKPTPSGVDTQTKLLIIPYRRWSAYQLLRLSHHGEKFAEQFIDEILKKIRGQEKVRVKTGKTRLGMRPIQPQLVLKLRKVEE